MTEQLTLEQAEAAIQSFCQYLCFETVSATGTEGAYAATAAWLLEYIHPVVDQAYYLPESPANAPVVVGFIQGINESLPVLLLNSHYDVVPAPLATDDESGWTVPPFQGLRKDGKIYGRGTQDMKSVGIQYIEALRYLRTTKPQRCIYITFVPDEEVGGAGMACFLESQLYKSLPGIALALDEGLASTTDTFSVFYGERLPWFVEVTAKGNTGHGSRFIENTAVEQLVELANKALAFRQGQRDILLSSSHEQNCTHAVMAAKQLGDVTSLNITTLQAGVRVGNTFAFNCVPPTAHCSLDIRISPHTDPSEIGTMLDDWCRECSKGNEPMTWSYIGKGHDGKQHALTPTDASNPWYTVFCEAMKSMGYEIQPQVFPAATDSRFLRALGIRALGFSPMRSCPILLHENDEYIPEQSFVEGIQVYMGLIQALAAQTF